MILGSWCDTRLIRRALVCLAVELQSCNGQVHEDMALFPETSRPPVAYYPKWVNGERKSESELFVSVGVDVMVDRLSLDVPPGILYYLWFMPAESGSDAQVRVIFFDAVNGLYWSATCGYFGS